MIQNRALMGPEGGARFIDEGFPMLCAAESIEAFTARLDDTQSTKGLHGRLAHGLGNIETSFRHGSERAVFLAKQLQCAAQTRIASPAIGVERQPTCQGFDGVGYLDVLRSLT